MSGIVISNSESSETYILCRCKIQCQALELVTWGELLAWGATAWGRMHGDTGYPLGCVLCHLSGWKRDGQHRGAFSCESYKSKAFLFKTMLSTWAVQLAQPEYEKCWHLFWQVITLKWRIFSLFIPMFSSANSSLKFLVKQFLQSATLLKYLIKSWWAFCKTILNPV